jgi:cobalt/nickel transport system ATP-binding protein
MVLELCERTIILHDGRIRAYGSIIEIFHNGQILSKNHLEKPFRLQGCTVYG